MCLMIISKVTKDQRFNLSVEDMFFEKPQGEGEGGGGEWRNVKLTLPCRFRVKSLKHNMWIYFFSSTVFA